MAAMVLLFIVLGLMVGEATLWLVPTHDANVRTMSRFIAVGGAALGGLFRLDVMNSSNVVLDLLVAVCTSLGAVLFLRTAHRLILRAEHP